MTLANKCLIIMTKETDMRAFRLNLCRALVCGISFLFSASASHGAAGDVLWTNQLDVANGTDRALAVATQACRRETHGVSPNSATSALVIASTRSQRPRGSTHRTGIAT